MTYFHLQVFINVKLSVRIERITSIKEVQFALQTVFTSLLIESDVSEKDVGHLAKRKEFKYNDTGRIYDLGEYRLVQAQEVVNS